MVEIWQDIARKEVTLRGMGITREDKGIKTHDLIALKFLQHLIRVADNGCAAA